MLEAFSQCENVEEFTEDITALNTQNYEADKECVLYVRSANNDIDNPYIKLNTYDERVHQGREYTRRTLRLRKSCK